VGLGPGVGIVVGADSMGGMASFCTVVISDLGDAAAVKNLGQATFGVLCAQFWSPHF